MWITCFVLLAVAQGVVDGYRHKTTNHLDDNYSDEDLYTDLDSWNGRDDRFDSPASNAISAAEHSLAAAKAFVQAKKYAKQALAAAKQAAEAAALAGKHSKMAAHIASKAASRSAAHLSKVPGVSSTSGGKKPSSSSTGGSKAGSAAGGNKNLSRGSSRPTISGTPTGPKTSSSSAGASKILSFNVILRFPTFHYSSSLSQTSSKVAVILKRRMIQAMTKVFKGHNLPKCEIRSFKRGSLLVDFFLKFASPVKNPSQLIKKAIQKGYFAGLPVQKTLFKLYNIKRTPSSSKPGAKGCTPCKTLAPGVKILSQKQCPTGYCATLMINPSQVGQAAPAPAPVPAQAPAYSQPAMAPAQPSYNSCPQMCQPPAAQYSCPPACPPLCCTMGKK